MIIEHKFKMGVKDIGKQNLIKNRSLLEMLENIGGYHSDLAGYGANDIERTKIAWILVGWKMQVIKRPKYGNTINIKTWGRAMSKVITYRDFEVYDEENNLCAIATSKWTLLNIETGRLARLTDEMYEKYQMETDKNVFENPELEKIENPKEYSNIFEYTVGRRDIDLNGHMHNLYYLDLAYEALPEDVNEKRPFDNVQIQYKKEVKYGEKVKCKYSNQGGKHIVVVYSENEENVHAIIELC